MLIMILMTHALIGAAAAKALNVQNPIAAIVLGYASHLLSDAIPHWDYPILSFSGIQKLEDRRFDPMSVSFRKDVLRVAFDFSLGISLALLFMRPSSPAQATPLLLAAFGGMLPDLLQGAYFTGYAPWLAPLQRLHDWCHTKIRLGPYPKIGIPFQIAIALLAISILI